MHKLSKLDRRYTNDQLPPMPSPRPENTPLNLVPSLSPAQVMPSSAPTILHQKSSQQQMNEDSEASANSCCNYCNKDQVDYSTMSEPVSLGDSSTTSLPVYSDYLQPVATRIGQVRSAMQC